MCIRKEFDFTTLIIIVVLLLQSTALMSQDFVQSPRIEQAYQSILRLELDQAQYILDQEKQEFPSNYFVYHIENYIDFYKIFISEDEELFEQLEEKKFHRLHFLEQGNEDSPYYLFSQAEVYLQWALARLKFQEYVKAVFEINKAIKLLELNQTKFPDFIANKKSLSALHAVMGTIPNKYKYLLKYISYLDGTIEQGYSEIQDVISQTDPNDFLFYEESVVIKALIELHFLNEKDLAFATIQKSKIDTIGSPLATFIVANISHRSGKNDIALKTLEKFKPNDHQYPMLYLEYLKGVYKLNNLDQSSKAHFENYISQFSGQNYIKEAYQKLAWHALCFQEDEAAYLEYMDNVLQYGKAITDEDKQAESMAKNKELPEVYILKARLLSDGGYFQRSKEMLLSNQNKHRRLSAEIEFAYRLGKVYDELNESDQAIEWYNKTIELPFQKQYYFQTAAHLYLAQLYEKQKKYLLASTHYEQCIESQPEQYASSLHQKAKAGKQRVKVFIEKP